MHRTIKDEQSSSSSAPLAAKLGDIAAGRGVRSFHALPLLGAARDMPAVARRGFEELFGGALPTADLSFSGRALDSFFAPDGPLAAAQAAAASAFGVEEVFFGTCGTTVSNRAALMALVRAGGRVLIDGACHQSVMFTATAARLPMTTVPPLDVRGSALTDVDSMAGRLSAAAHSGDPYVVAVITATSYDGYILDMREVLPRLIEASPSTALLIDSAWGAVHSFSGRLRPYTAMSAVGELRSADVSLPPIVVTASAHKSMCAMRQGSFILLASGGEATREALQAAIFSTHTTSPSWTILGSLDLARHHAQVFGDELIEQAIGLRLEVSQRLAANPLTAPLVADRAPFEGIDGVVQDPMKLTIDPRTIGGGVEAGSRLYGDYGIYVSRCSPAGLQFNFHIGVSAQDADDLVHALHGLAWRAASSTPAGPSLGLGSTVDRYVVPYPPGIPIAVPGDTWCERKQQAVLREEASGARVFHIVQPA
ncbi:hypothetical protein ACIQTZ_11235 [Paenarthrobacter sp. NPDC090520]|uniref:hypothetical protein n=1 Tax=unclassified Paenarthrobacter TaxID=2634190 RepID=UPI003820A786